MTDPNAQYVDSTVLVVDDDPAMGSTIVDILGLRGLEAECVTTAAAALRRFAASHPEVAIVDHRLPDMPGVDLCAALKEADPDLSIILLTGYASLESAIAAVPHVDEYLTKPVPPDELLRAVSSGKERSELRRNNRRLLKEIQEANSSLQSSVKVRTGELAGLMSMIEAAAAAPDLDTLAGTLVASASQSAGAEAGALYVISEESQTSAALAASWGLGQFPARFSRQTKRTLSDDGRVALPLVVAARTVGYLVFQRPDLGREQLGDIYLRALASQAAVAVQNVLQLQQARDNVERLSELSRLKSWFLASVSHELRTPLAAILGFSELLTHPEADLPADERAYLVGRIRAQAIRLGELIEDLLDASRLEFGGFRVKIIPVLVDELLASVHEEFPDDAARISINVEAGLRSVLGDPGRLKQVMINLVHNALKYSAPPKLVEVGARSDGGHTVIAVRDHGEGIDPEFLPRIFDPFSQADGGDTRRDSGLGLGLYLSRGLVEAMGGTLEVTTEAGVGSTFEVRLPASGA
jgi:signal transduction histidine kinase